MSPEIAASRRAVVEWVEVVVNERGLTVAANALGPLTKHTALAVQTVLGWRYEYLSAPLYRVVRVAWDPSSPGLPPEAAAPTWTWSADCGEPSLVVEVRSADALLFKSPLPVCRLEPGVVHDRSPERGEFSFTPTRVVNWSWQPWRSYPPAAAGQTLSVEIEQHDATPDVLELGFVFASKNGLATWTHTVHPWMPETSDPAENLTITTYRVGWTPFAAPPPALIKR